MLNPAEWAPCPASPASRMVMLRNVVLESTKNKRTPTDEAPSTRTFSNHAPVAFTSIAALAIPGEVAPEEPVPRTVRLVKSADS